MPITTRSAEETQQLAKKLAQDFKNGGVIGLVGDLGAGKTTFTQGFAQGLGIKDQIISPTYILIRQHPIPKTNKTLYHVDLYRLEDTNIEELGLKEIFDSDNIILIEWAEKIKDALPKNTVIIHFDKIDDSTRRLRINQKK